MTEFEKTLLNLRSLRAYARNLETTELQEALDKMTIVVQERRQEKEALDAKKAERNILLATVAKQIQREGIDVDALIDAMQRFADKKSKRAPRPVKYRYVDVMGEVKTWTGQGRKPAAIQEKLNSGASIDDFLI
ncbi:H-NS family histone-like protein [Vibrio harveyi]|uniref:DNA-binding protein n=1 Tax=Vibrio harveyi TaxID=669 RepID=A0ABM5XT31_VIBHA|nr:H-NS family nucleoid-associated regulatory protein [Vibrio harveyi]AMF96232.1 transcriptional regulator [Vibrio harveyi]